MRERPRGRSSSQVSDWLGRSRITLPSGQVASIATPTMRFAADSTSAGTVGTVGSTFYDLSGNGNNGTIGGTAGACSLVTGATPAGKTVVQVTPLGHAILPTALFSGMTAAHIFCYAKSASSAAQRTRGPFLFTNSGTNGNQWLYDNDNAYENAFYTGRLQFVPSISVRGAWRLYEVESSATDFIVRLDGTVVSSGAGGFAVPTNARFGSHSFGSTPNGNFMVADLYVYSSVLTTTEAVQVRDLLITTYGTTG